MNYKLQYQPVDKFVAYLDDLRNVKFEAEQLGKSLQKFTAVTIQQFQQQCNCSSMTMILKRNKKVKFWEPGSIVRDNLMDIINSSLDLHAEVKAISVGQRKSQCVHVEIQVCPSLWNYLYGC